MAGDIKPTGRSPGSGFQQAYEDSAALAFEKLAAMDINQVCRRSGAIKTAETVLSLVYIGENYQIDIAQRQFIGKGGQPVTADQLIMLHYLTGSQLTDDQLKPITFKELPGGLVYYPTYLKRCVKPLVERFGDKPDVFIASGVRLGATSIPSGDAGIYLQALPRIGINIVLWRGDEELSAEGTIYFSSNIRDYLSTEEIAALSQSIAIKLIKAATLKI